MEPFTPDPFQPVVQIVESMDVLTGEWRREMDMPEPNQGGAYAVVENKIFLLGGGNGNGAELATVNVWDLILLQNESPTDPGAPIHAQWNTN